MSKFVSLLIYLKKFKYVMLQNCLIRNNFVPTFTRKICIFLFRSKYICELLNSDLTPCREYPQFSLSRLLKLADFYLYKLKTKIASLTTCALVKLCTTLAQVRNG